MGHVSSASRDWVQVKKKRKRDRDRLVLVCCVVMIATCRYCRALHICRCPGQTHAWRLEDSIYLAHILMSARVSENVAIFNLVDAVIEPTPTLANDLRVSTTVGSVLA